MYIMEKFGLISPLAAAVVPESDSSDFAQSAFCSVSSFHQDNASFLRASQLPVSLSNNDHIVFLFEGSARRDEHCSGKNAPVPLG